ncbi:MAG: hypothetical protein Phyf2KO_23060 [Phycisphaerales bacterium]
MPRAINTPVSDVLVVQSDGHADHLAGVEDHLLARGLSVRFQSEPYLCPRVDEDTRVVVVTGTSDPRCIRALKMARGVGARTMLMMDGLVEYRNTFQNSRAGENFLRPAPVDLVCCSGLVDVNTLRALGNHATATGLPRIDALFSGSLSAPGSGPVLVATANNPAFDLKERERLLNALRKLKDASHWSKTRLIWRLTDGLDDELGVQNYPGTLWEALDDSSAVITTASTLHVEAMRAGRPTAILHPHPTPLWQPAAWVWDPGALSQKHDSSSVEPMTLGLSRFVDSPERLLRQLASPTQEQMDRQRECLTLLDASSGESEAAELVAEAIAELARMDKPRCDARIRPVARVATHKPRRTSRKRVVSIVPFGLTPIGGVTTWSRRLAAAFEQLPDLGYDMQTLLVAIEPQNAQNAMPLLNDHTSLCVIDPTDDHFVTLANLRRSVEQLEPDILLPNFSDLCYSVATQLRYKGVPSVAIAHTDHEFYVSCMNGHPDWDAAVSVSESINSWLLPLADGRPLETIVYGVPSATAPRDPQPASPIRIAYVGRLADFQKRVFDLIPLTQTLAADGVDAELHIVGEGPEGQELRNKLRSIGTVQVKYHGPQSPDWVQLFWPTVDVAVLVSEFEGTSITMLEAMGHGVVPAVTRVSSGVDDWVEDGVSGVTAPVGDPKQLARRIADLAGDRRKLQSIGHAAWRRVSKPLSLDSMAAKYATLFDKVLSRTPVTRPSLAGVRIGDWHIWSKTKTEDIKDEIAWLRARLTEAGYRDVSVGEPGSRCDVVIISTETDDPTKEQLDQWYKRGIDVVWSTLIPNGGVLAERLRQLTADGYSRIAVYGLGRHTRKFAGLFESNRYPVVGFIDDCPPKSGTAYGLDAMIPEQALERLRPDVVLLSSDAWEQRLWANSRPLRKAGVHVQPIYGVYEDKPESETALLVT